MKKESMVPPLRFPEFREDWEQRRLGEITATFRSGKGITAKDISMDGQYPVYGGNGLRGFANTFTHSGTYILIGRQGALCGNITIVEGNTFISEHAIAVQTDAFSDDHWLAHKLTFMNLNQYSESSAQPGLAVNKLIRHQVLVPTLAEQQKIAAFLNAVDDKIEQLTKKKALLEQYKKGVMQQIFNREIRFKDENGDDYPEWKEIQLGNVGENIIGLTYSPKDVSSEGVIVLRSSNIKDNRLDLKDLVKVNTPIKNKLRIRTGDILICTRNGSQRLIGKNILIREAGEFTFGAFMSVFRSTLNTFIYHLMQTSYYYEQVQVNLGARINQITTGHLNRFKFNIPTDERERTKIANFLSALDDKIGHVDQQIELTKQYKKGLLQQMFV